MQLEERSISIKVLRIDSKKQLTQAFFKQLPEANPIDHGTGSLRGIIWGRITLPAAWNEQVNFVLWELNGQLFQCPLSRTWYKNGASSQYMNKVREDALFLLLAYALDGYTFKEPDRPNPSSIAIEIGDEKIEVSPSKILLEMWDIQASVTSHERYRGHDADYAQREKERISSRQQAWYKFVTDTLTQWYDGEGNTGDDLQIPTPEQATKKIVDGSLAIRNAYKQTWEENQKAIYAAEQIFVGV